MNLKNYPQKNNGMYVLRNQDFETIGEMVLGEYMPGNLVRPQPTSIDSLIYDCLNLEITSKYISRDGTLLGMIAFEDLEWEVFAGSGAEKQVIPAGTIVIDASLSGLEQRPRCRFTKAHEASHWILHRAFHSPERRVYNFRTTQACVACRQDKIERLHWNYGEERSDEDWEEWQADSLAAALLMPYGVFFDAASSVIRNHGIHYGYLVKGERIAESIEIIREIAEIFDVSMRAAQIRMCHMGLIRKWQ